MSISHGVYATFDIFTRVGNYFPTDASSRIEFLYIEKFYVLI